MILLFNISEKSDNDKKQITFQVLMPLTSNFSSFIGDKYRFDHIHFDKIHRATRKLVKIP
jgi:hypothetical protein